jgi:hypothetical protein
MAITNADAFISSMMIATKVCVTLKAWMCLTTYYLGLLQVHQAHAKQDAQNKGNHQWHCSLQVLFALKSKVVTYVEEH